MRPKAAKVEPHTHTKRYAGDFLWSWQAEWLAGACAVHTYIHTYIHTYVRTYIAFHDILTWGNFPWKSRDEGKEKEIEINNGKGWETPLKNSVKHPSSRAETKTRKTKEQYSREIKATRNKTERYWRTTPEENWETPTENCKHVGYSFVDFYLFVIGNNFVPPNNLRLRFCFLFYRSSRGKKS